MHLQKIDSCRGEWGDMGQGRSGPGTPTAQTVIQILMGVGLIFDHWPPLYWVWFLRSWLKTFCCENRFTRSGPLGLHSFSADHGNSFQQADSDCILSNSDDEMGKNSKSSSISLTFTLPPHTSHILQTLDNSVHGPLKSYYTLQLARAHDLDGCCKVFRRVPIPMLSVRKIYYLTSGRQEFLP